MTTTSGVVDGLLTPTRRALVCDGFKSRVAVYRHPQSQGQSSSLFPRRSRTSSSLTKRQAFNNQQEFEMEVGKALDVLRSDYPQMLTQLPDFSIYDQNLVIVDPAGVTMKGLKNYRQAFRLVHSVVKLFYCPEKSLLTFRLVYDCARNNIRVSWNVEVVPKVIFGGERQMLHVDGISVYEIKRSDGKVSKHRIEHIIINDKPVAPKQGLWSALERQADADCSIPVFYKTTSTPSLTRAASKTKNTVLEFTVGPNKSRGQKSLFNNADAADTVPSTNLFMYESASSGNDDILSLEYPNLDVNAFQSKNRVRIKFGVDPLTPEEFLEVQAQIQEMELQTQNAERQRQEDQVAPQKKGGFFKNIFGDILENTCETNLDCERPEICCDFGAKKMCCSSGAFVGMNILQERALQPALVRVPSTIPFPEERRS